MQGVVTGWLSSEAWQALGLTVRLAAVVTVLLLLVAVPTAGWLASTRSRVATVVEALVGLPVVLPPTVIGFYLLSWMAPGTPLGRLWDGITGETLAFSFPGLVLGSIFYSLPFAVQPLTAAMRAVPESMVEAARSLGGRRLGVFLRITLPLSWRGVVVAAMLAFAHTLGEFGVVVMLGGSIPGRTRVASIVLFDQVQRLDHDAAHRLAATLVALALAFVVPLVVLQRRLGRR